MLRALLLIVLTTFSLSGGVSAQSLQDVLQQNEALVSQASRRTVSTVIDAVIATENDAVPGFLEKWRERDVWQRDSDKLFFFVQDADADTYSLIDIETGESAGTANKDDLSNLRPNSGVREVIGAALVQFQLASPDPARRQEAITAIERAPEASHLAALRRAVDDPDPDLKARKARLELLLAARFETDPTVRIGAIEALGSSLSLETRAALNPILSTQIKVFQDVAPQGTNIAARLTPGTDALSQEDAYALLVANDSAPARISVSQRNAALIANINGARVGGIAVADLNTEAARDVAYAALVTEGVVLANPSLAERMAATASARYYQIYDQPNPDITAAAASALETIDRKVAANQMADLLLDGISLASIYFLAAIGLAITFGVMGVINMAHGEFIMMGAYTGYVVQLFIPNYTVSLIVALPLAFAVTFGAGVLMERLVIRWLYHRPLETLLATFGISIALQQLAKNIFGTQARPLTSPGWLDGAWVMNDVVSISYIRIAIFVLAMIFFVVLLYILKRTRLGLEVRAVTQNPRMAASMGIRTDRINMLTFGLGSGIAGIAGVAIGLFAQVTSELGSGYIVQSFMTVVVGGVGNIWGTLAGATMIGFVQKGIEFFNPSNTLAAQTYMVIFVILFIQFRPKGIIALKGRAAEA
jgi:urea transport system permease protein